METVTSFGGMPWWLVAVGGVFSYLLTTYIYNLFLHPLCKFPGPLAWQASRLPFALSMVTGNLPFTISALHEEFGPIVRVAPDELSFIDPFAWGDIYGNRAGQPAFDRPRMWKYGMPGANFFTADDGDHARFRKALAPSFSANAMKGHEGVVKWYVSGLVHELGGKVLVDPEEPFDLVKWLNLATFDIIGDLAFGENFEGLRQQKYHPWVATILSSKAIVFAIAAKYWAPLATLLDLMTPRAAKESLELLVSTAKDKVARRLAMPAEQKSDLISHVLASQKSNKENSLTVPEIEGNALSLIIAGSETVTTALVGAFNHLLHESDKYQKLVSEIRSSFKSKDDITSFEIARRLPYVHAVLQETLRLCPPVPDGLRREVPAGGSNVSGHYLPGGTTVSVSQWAAYQSSTNFASPSEFIPERWLPSDPEFSSYTDDKKSVFQPFSVGRRDCIGQNLAWVEMRLLLVLILWHFDLEIPIGEKVVEWSNQKIFFNWDKEPLRVVLRPVEGHFE